MVRTWSEGWIARIKESVEVSSSAGEAGRKKWRWKDDLGKGGFYFRKRENRAHSGPAEETPIQGDGRPQARDLWKGEKELFGKISEGRERSTLWKTVRKTVRRRGGAEVVLPVNGG